MVTQILTIVGVIVGALGSYVAASQAERARHKRVLDTRWDERKLKMYADYANTVKLAYRCAKQAAKAQGDPASRDPLIAEMDTAEDQRSLLYEDLVLLGTEAAVDTADDVNRYLWTFLGTVRKQGPDPIDLDLDPRSLDLLHALTLFHNCARVDLGIPGRTALNHPSSIVAPASSTPATSSP